MHKEIVIRNRFETLSIVNDVLTSVVYLIGSLGMTARPAIRLARRFYLQRVGEESGTNESYNY